MSQTFAPGIRPLQRRSDNTAFAELEADLMPALTALKLERQRCTFVGTKGDIVCFLVDVEYDARKKVPALLLANKRNPTRRDFVVLNDLWLFCDPDVHDDAQATRTNRANQQRLVQHLAERLFGFVTKQDAFRVLDALFDFADDLKNAKPPQGYTLGQWLQALAEDDMTINFDAGDGSGRRVVNG